MSAQQVVPFPSATHRLAQSILQRSDVAICVEHGGRIGHHATGFLLAIGDYYFLITAAHAVFPALKQGANLYVQSSAPPGKAVYIKSKFFHLRGSPIDVAVNKLDDETLAQISLERFARLMDFSGPEPQLGDMLILGGNLSHHSETWMIGEKSPNAQLMRVNFFSQLACIPDPPPEFDPMFHIAALAELNWSITNDGYEAGEHRLQGISGSAVWRVEGDPWSPTWNPGRPYVIGFQSSILPNPAEGWKKYLKVIRANAALYLISEVFPTAGEIMREMRRTIIVHGR